MNQPSGDGQNNRDDRDDDKQDAHGFSFVKRQVSLSVAEWTPNSSTIFASE